MSKESEEGKKGYSLLSITSFGVVVTFIYIAGTAWLRWPFSINTLRIIQINELGDFLAGIFGPLSLFWLILGFLLQKNELKQSREALLLQAKELRDTLSQHKEAVATSKEQLQADLKANELQEIQLNKQIQPRFVIHSIIKEEERGSYEPKSDSSTSTGVFKHTVKFLNDGAPAANVTVLPHLLDRALAKNIERIYYVNTGETLKIDWKLKNDYLPPSASVSITYYDAIERKHTKEFSFHLTDQKIYASTNWNYTDSTDS
jgi:hypothetical protein